jgi:hypothetical protein
MVQNELWDFLLEEKLLERFEKVKMNLRNKTLTSQN